jgi:hypothetical protein
MCRKKMNKKGYIFLMDAIFAIVILLVGYLIISSNRAVETTEIPLSILAENTMDLFSNVRVSELCYDFTTCSCSNEKLEELCSNKDIENTNQTLLDYFGELYSRNKKTEAEELFKNLTLENDMLRQDVFGVEFNINDEKIYSNAGNKDQSKDLISVKRMSFGYFEDIETGQITFWGPYVMRLDIWQK